MFKNKWINPLWWIRSFSTFVWSWIVNIPVRTLGASSIAMVVFSIVVLGVGLTYLSDVQWRRNLVLGQFRSARQDDNKPRQSLLARRLLADTPTDQLMQYESAAADAEVGSSDIALATMNRLAKRERYGRAALWLLEKQFSPIQWDKWDERKRTDFGNLLQIASEDQPDNPMVASILADYLLLTGSPEKAMSEITKLVSVQPARALQGAMILRQTGKESQAVRMASDGLSMLAKKGVEEPENVNLALMRAQFCLFLKKYEDAVTILNKTAKLAQDPRLRSGTAEVLVLWSRDQMSVSNPTDRFARQLTLLGKAVEIAPNHPLVVNDLMSVALQCADVTDPKVAQLRDMLVNGVAPELTHFIRGTSAMLRDDVEEAALHLELAAKGLPSVPAVLNNLAVTLATRENSDLDRALKLVDASLQQVPKQPYFHETRAQILLKQKKYREAVVNFEQALSAEALREQVHDGLSQAYAALNQKELADEHLKISEGIRNAKKKDGPIGDVKVDFGSKDAPTKDTPAEGKK